ncbi:quinol:electron acceptor oxidoreductase subunit ActD [Aeoliella mucimassa]|uniref:Cytochrome c domain-containing protein n=1 Tax=Aeoliella mucimassa TaxID=2527972 RepID=A0A518AGY4_9BACT|nr:quinol:electron acceptor oxidoreductase subunit ActD [Aeoliella mucimassa]QDU53993.1 hypothetical protein Pan181_01730 [Aeoliella mucimassa]
MSHHDTKPEPAKYEPKVIGVLGEFAGPEQLVAGARAIREKGYRKVEAYSPFPVHGIDDALAAPKPILPWVVLGAGLTGCAVALLMQWYMNAFEAPFPLSGYDYGISGKPSWSLPANIPVTFELIVLFSAFTAFLGMIAFNKLPKFSNPLFRNERFTRATNDKFFLLIEEDDPQFATESITSAFEAIGAVHVEALYDQPTTPMPSWIVPVGAVLMVAGLIPLGLVAMNRNVHTSTPRLSIWWDMDYQPKYKAQTTIPDSLFKDGRSARLPVEGTVARGRGVIDPALELGYIPASEPTFETALLLQEEGTGEQPPAEEPAEETPADADEAPAEEPAEEESADQPADETTEAPAEKSTDMQEEPAAEPAAEPADEAPAEEPTAEESQPATDEAAPAEGGEAEAPAAPHYNWVSEFPEAITVDSDLMERGERQYNIYCAVCHGYAGDGDGLVHQRAIAREQLATWAPPTSIHNEAVVKYPVGQLFDTISNGNIGDWTKDGTPMRGRMAGYKQQISVKDRWAIVLYIKALQKSRLVTPDELSEQELASLK